MCPKTVRFHAAVLCAAVVHAGCWAAPARAEPDPGALAPLRRDLLAANADPARISAARAQLAALRAGLARDRRGVADRVLAGTPLIVALVPPPPPDTGPVITLAGTPPGPLSPRLSHGMSAPDDTPVRLALLFDLIARAEAGAAQYDAIHSRARIRPAAPPTQLTLGEILDWIEETPGQPHAIGRYQIIPDTLRFLMRTERLQPDVVYSAALQDRLATRLVINAGLDDYLEGILPPRAFMDNLAYVWAGLPLPDGQSAYRGIAGNRATISRAEYEREFLRIFPPPPLLIGLPPGPRLPEPALLP